MRRLFTGEKEICLNLTASEVVERVKSWVDKNNMTRTIRDYPLPKDFVLSMKLIDFLDSLEQEIKGEDRRKE